MNALRQAILGVLACVVALMPAFAARAQTPRADLVAGVDVERRGDEALISIRFKVPIAYQRHSPEDFGRSLRIYPGLTSAEPTGRRGTLRLPETDMVPRFSISYPHADDALLIEFDRPTHFEVHPGARSIVISVPVLRGATDWVVVTNDWAVAAVDPAQVQAALAASAAPTAEAPAQPESPKAPKAPEVFESGVQLAGFAGGGNGMYSLRVDSMKDVRFGTVVRQHQDWSCGSAAVATLLTYHYHHPISEDEALQAMYRQGNQGKIRREGFSMLDIKRFLESLGYHADGFETSLDRLAYAKVPAIVIINDHGYNHFVVVKGLRHGNVLLGDPARGNRVVSRAAFEAMWPTRIVFVITSRREGVAFNFSEDWRFMAAPLGDAVSRDSLGALLLTRPGPNDF